MESALRKIKDCQISEAATISDFVNLYGCAIGASFVGPFVEIQKNVSIGDRCRIQSHAFICEGVVLRDDVFIGHGVMFCNDKHPKANSEDWTLQEVLVKEKASIGSNATIVGPVTIGRGSLIGAGSVVTKDVPDGEIWAGNPARKI